eukprot:Blabericola_migrator_1__6821@NODE_3455_length_1761_cov_388_756198_g900_i1_p1_GENE_NODE_3455_length_1761_cov_388_756198_g900_i1NODE_3455_length_1761_cov_388_756198_g900_i1_p1_ORF_typecomplete_len212_score33_04_NODE_3455_length_1761_cov_388_756198_g900_i1145780
MVLALLLPRLKSECHCQDKAECICDDETLVINCLGLTASNHWQERLTDLKAEVQDVYQFEEEDCADVRWEYTQSVSPRLSMMDYPVDMPIMTMWVDGRVPIPEDKTLASMLSSLIPADRLRVDFHCVVDLHKSFLRRSTKADLLELALLLNETINPLDVSTLLSAPLVTPVRISKPTLGTEPITYSERACLGMRYACITSLACLPRIDHGA